MKTLFVDFDGTICFGRFWQSLPEKEYQSVQDFLFSESNIIVRNWMCGEYTSEEVTKLVSENTSLPYEYLWDIFVKDCRSFTVSGAILDTIQKLRNTYRTVLITGNMDSFDRFTAPTLNLGTYFDVIVNSYTERCLKSDDDGSTFLKYLGGDIREAVLIEDSVTPCEVFEKLGGKSLRVTPSTPALIHLQSLLSQSSLT